MKKTLKLVAIFISVIIVVVVGGLSIYFLIENNKTWYIYDVRIVEPLENANYYVYTDSSRNYTSLKNTEVFMISKEQDKIQIGIYAHTSNDATSVRITSSNYDVARPYVEDGKCYVAYYRAGSATITAEIGGVFDSFVLMVYDNIVDEFSVYDEMYYGNYATKPKYVNHINVYSDDTDTLEPYKFKYKATSGHESGNSEFVDSELLRVSRVGSTAITEDVDLNNLNGDIVSVNINTEEKLLEVKAKSGLEQTVNTSIVVQSYYMSDNGEIKVLHDYLINVRIIVYKAEFLQIELATTNNFEEKSIYLDTRGDIDPNDVPDADLEAYLANENAVNFLKQNGENPVYKVYFDDSVKQIYLKFRKVYTNGFIQELNKNTSTSYLLNGSAKAYITDTEYDFAVLDLSRVDKSSLVSELGSKLELTLSDSDGETLQHTFVFEYLNTKDNLNKFYTYEKESGTFAFNYWDHRMAYKNVITEKGKIVGFDDVSDEQLKAFFPEIDEPIGEAINFLGEAVPVEPSKIRFSRSV